MPQILDELAVALTVEASRFNQGMSQAERSLEGLKRQFAAAQGQITRAQQRLDAFERETNQVRVATDRASRSFSSQRDAVNTLGRRILGLAAAYIGFRQAARFIRSSTEAFFEQTRATNELAVALQRAGIVGTGALAQLERGASGIQLEFNLADEAITRATARVSAFAPALRLPDLERAQRAVAGLSHIMGDTDTAANALAKTLGGQTNLLGRYGITVNATASAQEKLNQVLAAPAVQTALVQLAANAQTVEGRVRAASIQWGEFKETMGGVIVDMVSAGNNANSLAGAIAGMTAKIEANREEWVRTGRIMVETVGVVASTITNIVQAAVSGIAAIVAAATFQIQTLIRVVRSLPTGPIGVGRALFGGEAQAGARGLGGELQNRFDQIKGDIKDVTMAWEAARQRVERGAQATGAAIASAAGNTEGFEAGLGAVARQADQVADALRSIVEQDRGFRALQDAIAGTSIEFDPLTQRASDLHGQMTRLTALIGQFPDRASEIRPVLAGIVAELDALTVTMERNAAATKAAEEAHRRFAAARTAQREALTERIEAIAEAQQDRLEELRHQVRRVTDSIEDAFVDVISGTASVADAFKRMVQSIIADLARLTIRRALIEPLAGIIAGSLGGGGGTGVTEAAPLGTHGRRGFVSASTGRFTSPAVAPAVPMTVVMQNTFEVRSIDTREGAQFLQQHAPAIGQLAAREFQKSAGLQSLVRGRR